MYSLPLWCFWNARAENVFILFVYRFLTLSDKYSLSLCRLFLWQKTPGFAAIRIYHESE
jgi:hypothetical protein